MRASSLAALAWSTQSSASSCLINALIVAASWRPTRTEGSAAAAARRSRRLSILRDDTTRGRAWPEKAEPRGREGPPPGRPLTRRSFDVAAEDDLGHPDHVGAVDLAVAGDHH